MADPWIKFYTSDWRSDPALRMCSIAARGVWIEMICLMHEASPYGHLLVNGHRPTDAQLAVLVGMPPDQLSDCKGELEAAGVFSTTKEGVIYSRKMTRMAKKAATARRNGRKGGNPKLSKESENSALDNLPDKAQDKPQKPEARSQIYKRDTNVSPKKRRATSIPEDAIVSPDFIRIAEDKGVSQQEAEAQFERFKGHALANGKTYKDWNAAWRNWLTSPYFKSITTGGRHEHSQPHTTSDLITLAARANRASG